jgi:hypothetical protein
MRSFTRSKYSSADFAQLHSPRLESFRGSELQLRQRPGAKRRSNAQLHPQRVFAFSIHDMLCEARANRLKRRTVSRDKNPARSAVPMRWFTRSKYSSADFARMRSPRLA